jgi:hypothetical protein
LWLASQQPEAHDVESQVPVLVLPLLLPLPLPLAPPLPLALALTPLLPGLPSLELPPLPEPAPDDPPSILPPAAATRAPPASTLGT